MHRDKHRFRLRDLDVENGLESARDCFGLLHSRRGAHRFTQRRIALDRLPFLDALDGHHQMNDQADVRALRILVQSQLVSFEREQVKHRIENILVEQPQNAVLRRFKHFVAQGVRVQIVDRLLL